MIEFDLSVYNNNTKYISFFDAYIKAKGDTKKEILDRLNISSSNISRARDNLSASEKTIITKLSKYYKVTIENSKLFKEIELLSNKIYNSAYYMNFDNFNEDIKLLDKKIKKNGILTPILKLLKLFYILCKYSNAKVTDVETVLLYEEVSKYKKYFDQNLQNILDIISLYMNDKNAEKFKGNNNPLYLQMLATKCADKGKFMEALVYAEEAKNIFATEMNFKRLIVVNRIRIYSFLCIKNYQKAYDISKYQRKSVRTFSKDIYDVEMTNGHYYISMLGLKMYDKIIDMSESIDSLNTYEYICYLISLFKYDYSLYEDHINNDLNCYTISTNDKVIINNIIEYLNTKNKIIINRLKDLNLNIPLIMILEDL